MRELNGIGRHRGQRGAALVLSLVLVMVCAALGAAFLQVASSTAQRQSHEVRQTQAFYLAEAGLAEGFMAVRMGRTGAVGSEELPARYGHGEIFVESVHTSDGRVFLRSSAERERSGAVLGLIVEPPPPVLGFFAHEDLVIENVLLVDGFDSTERSYAEEVRAIQEAAPPAEDAALDPADVPEFKSARAHAATFADAMTRERIESMFDNQVTDYLGIEIVPENLDQLMGVEFGWSLTHAPIDARDDLGDDHWQLFVANLRPMYLAYKLGVLFEGQSRQVAAPAGPGPLDSGWFDTPVTDPGRLENHTLRGGLIGSNGDVHFVGDAAGSEIHGSVVPGVDGAVLGASADTASGSTAPRALPAELDEVVVPALSSDGDRQIVGGIPEIISGAAVRYDSLTVGPSEDLVLRGPVTLVVDHLAVSDDALVTLDTTYGEVDLYVTDSMSLSPTSVLETTASTSDRVTIHGVSDAPAGSTLDLSASSRFHGTVYAPASEVRVGSNFEVFGGIVARRLSIAAGARLHFDDPSYDGESRIPFQESWKILELPEVPRGGIPTRPDPSSRKLGMAHDVAEVELEIRYLDAGGAEQVYAGVESGFDYSLVAEVRSATRRVTAAAADAVGAPDDATPSWWDSWARDAVDGFLERIGSEYTADELAAAAASGELGGILSGGGFFSGGGLSGLFGRR